MPPTTTSTAACWTSRAAAASATLSSVALSSTYNSTGRPRRPPPALMSSITILATLTLAVPMKDRAPVWSVMTPTRAGRLVEVVIVASSRLVRAEEQGRLRLAQMSGLLEDRRDLGVGDELHPPGLVPVEERPDPVLLGGVAEHRRTLGAVERTLVRALLAEHIQEPVDVLDGGGGQDHDCPLFVSADRFGGRRDILRAGRRRGIGIPTYSQATIFCLTAQRVAAARLDTPIFV